MFSRLFILACLVLSVGFAEDATAQLLASSATPQRQSISPEQFEILGVSVTGVENAYTQTLLQQSSGLNVGDTVTIPGDPAFSEAIRAIYRLGMFSDVRIVEERRIGQGIFLVIEVLEVPKLADYTFEGVKKGHRKDLREEVPLIKRSPVRQSSIERANQVIRSYYAEKGYPLTTINVERVPSAEDNTITLNFQIDKGPRVEVGAINLEGNSELSDRRILKKLKTKENRWWRFWKKETFKKEVYAEDIQRILDLYNENGFYDAQISRDTVFINESGKPEMVVELDIDEGSKFFIRNITWEGNTLYRTDGLTEALGILEGQPYNSKRLEENLYGNKRSSDISSMYYNLGYLRFNLQKYIRVVGEDSLDLHFDIFEGDVYRFGNINIAGNSKTKEHVVRRELITVPGRTFSREDIQESIRRLMQLSYFTQESLAPGPGMDIRDADKTVDLSYVLEETGSDQLELSGTWGQFGLILQLRFSFNNFSAQNMFKKDAWRPLPSGDGQKLSVGIQASGRFYQQYSLSFSEPWFRGKPRLLGFSTSFSRISQNPFSRLNTGSLITASGRVFYEQRLKWPDSFFSSSTSLGYQFFDNRNWISTLPNGISQEVTIRQALSRNSTNHPYFPSSGSKMQLSLEIAPPIGDLIQYHKWGFTTSWNMTLTNKLSLGISTNYGFLGSLTGKEVAFERYVVGGSPFETQGYFSFFGKDVIYMRGYPISSLGPRKNNEPVGGSILNMYNSEFRWMAITSPQLQAAPYLFIDAANTWNSFSDYNPSSLYRSAGMGIRLFLPILGLVELTYGYNFDEFTPINNRHDGSKKWTFQFSLGQGFGQ